GVRKSAYAAWFGGIYQDPKNFFPNFSVSADFIELYPEYVLPPQQLADWKATRDGAIVGAALAEKHGWKIGDVIPLQATIFPNRDGSNDWPLKLSGIFHVADAKRRGEENTLWFHWDYFNESNQYVKGYAGWWVVEISPGANPDRVAKAIDALSANSDRETKTSTEQAFNQSFIKQFADIGLIVSSIMGAVFFTLLLLTGNTMAQAVRERIPELAVLKTQGFANRTVLWLVLAESVLLVLVGGVLGLAASALVIGGVSAASQGIMQMSTIQLETWAAGIGLMVAIGVLVGLLPAVRGMRLNIVDALAGR
ncbi:MAG: ABC transporter permease, partial [Pseudomonadota bacterium]|nr:ABC transporter permease [Pseudomonadota bacterium]